jgi:hypothetical protein
MTDETMAARRERLLRARAEREEAARSEREAHELVVLELEDRFSSELGKRGSAFELVNEENSCGEGPIVVKAGDTVAHKAWMAKAGATIEDQFAYAVPWVIYPERELASALFLRRPQLLSRVVIALNQLYGQSHSVLLGKV